VTGVDLVFDARARLGEGPVWDPAAGVLWWVDIEGECLHAFDPRTGRDREWSAGQMVGCALPRSRGGLVVGAKEGLAFFDPHFGRLEVFARPEADRPGNRFNDGACDSHGRLWAGTMAVDCAAGAGCLYRVDADLSVHRMLERVTVSNGLAWSADGRTLYYVDTPTRRVDALECDPVEGEVGTRRPAVLVPPELGWPDGMTIDEEGMLWVAHWDGHAVCRWDPLDARLLRRIELPVARVTSCAFGGADLDELYVTTAWSGLSETQRAAQPLAGGLFVVRPGVRGQPPTPYAG
jgi:sugar lactone lactonase YvrE